MLKILTILYFFEFNKHEIINNIDKDKKINHRLIKQLYEKFLKVIGVELVCNKNKMWYADTE